MRPSPLAPASPTAQGRTRLNVRRRGPHSTWTSGRLPGPQECTGGSRIMVRTIADPRTRSRQVTEGPERAPHRAMLRATGLGDDDLRKPLVGVASSWNEVTPCNLHLDADAKEVKQGVREIGRARVGKECRSGWPADREVKHGEIKCMAAR